MKSVLCSFVILLLSATASAQHTYQVKKDSVTNQDMLVGSIQKSDLTTNPEFSGWYRESQKIYPTPNPEAVRALSNHKNDIYFIIFGGTWCEDTHFVLPKFFQIQEAAQFPLDRIALFALDRHKKMDNPIAESLDVLNVPTIIVMKNGKEVGRVVEYGKTGYWDKELGTLVDKAQ